MLTPTDALKPLYNALLCALAAAWCAPVWAQPQLEKVEITGSALKRIDAESSMPVIVIKREDITRSGATSVVDLMNKLPAIQGATQESSAEGTESYGFAGLSIHNLGETRTLVLLNGHRLASFGGQTLTGFAAAFDLNSLPLAAIERVEVLTDGASALYGADAIAGVVNFITRRDVSEGDVSVGFSLPQGGAQETRASATKGYGSLQDDGFNVLLSFSHDQRTALSARDRSFASNSVQRFSLNGKNYQTNLLSAYAAPANVIDGQGQLVSPYLQANGSCPPNLYRQRVPYNDGSGLVDDYCAFDPEAELDLYPERQRESFLGSFTKSLGEQELFVDVLASRTTSASRIAPARGVVFTSTGDPALYRTDDLGGRTYDDRSKFYDLAAGSRGTLSGWDYKSTLTYSRNHAQSDSSGYPGALALSQLVGSGVVNPLLGPGQQSAAGAAALRSINYQGYWNGGTSSLTTLSLGASRDLMALPGGPLALGLGTNLNVEHFHSQPSRFAQGLLADPVAGTLCDPDTDPSSCDQRFSSASQTRPYSASRRAWGVYGELSAPVLKDLELNAGLRFDRYSDFGSASTAKGSFRWKATPGFMLRGSVGTGFRAPSVPMVSATPQPYGFTGNAYDCNAAMVSIAASLGAVCRPNNNQYDIVASGNHDLSPEKSLQGSLGFRVEPNDTLSIGADLWHVAIKNVFDQLNESVVFADPDKYRRSWATSHDVATNTTYLAFLQDNQNLGNWYSTGIDLDSTLRVKTSEGLLSSQLTLTYMIREDRQLEQDGAYYSAIGMDSPELGYVTFRWQARWANTWKTEHFAHTFTVNMKSGYTDTKQVVDVLDSSGNVTGSEEVQLAIEQFTTLDWQTVWTPRKDWALTMGVLNVFNTAPPLSLGTSGVGRGQAYGYDNRYYDARGRTFYLNGAYKF